MLANSLELLYLKPAQKRHSFHFVNQKKRWSQIEPKFDRSRQRWKIEVPESLGNSKRSRIYFAILEDAREWIAQRALDDAQGKAVAITSRTDRGMKLDELLRLFLDGKKHIAPLSLKILKNHLAKLSAAFPGCTVEKITPWAAKQWITKLDCSQRTRYGVWSDCRSLYRWAQRYQLAEKNPFDQMEPETKGQPQRAILTPDQFEKLLQLDLPQDLRIWLVLGGFAGIRTIETKRMTWEAIDFRRSEIFVGRDVIKRTKGLRHRHVEMLPACKLHLPKGKKGHIFTMPESTFGFWRSKLACSLGFQQWPHNCLRHSYASYHLAMFQDSAKLALQLGHTSPEMIFSNYAETVPRGSARRWWGIKPKNRKEKSCTNTGSTKTAAGQKSA